MNEIIMYFLKVNIAIALFYLFYRLVFYNDTFWGARRFYLVFAILLSALHPLISLAGWLEKQEPMQAIMTNYVQLEEITVSAAPGSYLTIENMLLTIYALAVIILFSKMCVQLVSILRWRLKGKRQELYGIDIVAIDETITPFSFLNSIFMNPALHNEQETLQILAHEKTHTLQMHSLDVMLSEMLTIICWMNPAAWLLKREMRQNLEFLADNSVLKSGFDSKNYQYHLLQLSYQVPKVNLVNKFNVSPLKKRITMMNQQKTAKAGILKYSLIIPLALTLVLSSNAQTVVNKAKKALSGNTESISPEKGILATNETVAPEIKVIQPKEGKKDVYQVVEKMPVYPGGVNELRSYLARSIRYPVEAQKNNVQGRVIVRFIVNESGKVEDATALKSTLLKSEKLDELVVVGYGPANEAGNATKAETTQSSTLKQLAILENEAIRVVSAMQNWIPGEQNSKKVSVYYTLPIVFKLNGGNKSTENKDNGKLNVKAINGKETPLFVLDGKVIPASEASEIRNDNIKEINVLKDQAATAVYGENGKNGVILISSKK